MLNNQKDTQKTSQNNRPLGTGLTRFDSQNSLYPNVFEYANKKTEKLVTALYMITDCMETDDALKSKLRLLGVELLSDMYKLSTLSPLEKHSYINISLTHIYEILSFIEISYTIGFISEMNTFILKNEFNNLISELKSHKDKDKHFTFTLDEKMFNISDPRQGLRGKPSIKDNKRTQYNSMLTRPIGVSFIEKSPLQEDQIKRTNQFEDNIIIKKERINKILSLIKDKSNGGGSASIKDISLAFENCSEKTIQRELNALVSKGQIKKTGDKRWSRYSIVDNLE